MVVWPRLGLPFRRERGGDALRMVWSSNQARDNCGRAVPRDVFCEGERKRNVECADGRRRGEHTREDDGKGTARSTLGLEKARSLCDPGREGANCLRGTSLGSLSQHPTPEFSERAIPV